MLKLSKLSDYATVILTDMSLALPSCVTAMEISQATGIPLPTVSKILKILTRSGILESVRGARGGYTLARPAEDISMSSVLSAMEGPLAITECVTTQENCQQAAYCGLRGNWNLINRAIQSTLEAISLADMSKPIAEPPASVRVPVESIGNSTRR